MRELSIAYGNSRNAKKWVNKTIKYDALKERLKTPIRTTESAEEYAKMSKTQRADAKDHGGFVGGVLKGGRRKADMVTSRSMIALDGDRIDRAFLENYETNVPYTSCLYTTHSSTEEKPRVRIIFPLTRDVTPDEFAAVSRYVAQSLGMDYFDECSYQPNQLMYWPSTPMNGVFVYKEAEKEWLDPDVILAAHPEWTDITRLPTSSRESKAKQAAQKKAEFMHLLLWKAAMIISQEKGRQVLLYTMKSLHTATMPQTLQAESCSMPLTLFVYTNSEIKTTRHRSRQCAILPCRTIR